MKAKTPKRKPTKKIAPAKKKTLKTKTGVRAGYVEIAKGGTVRDDSKTVV